MQLSFLKNEILISAILFYFFSSLFAVSVPHLERGTIGSIVINPLFAILSLYSVSYLIRNNKTIVSYLILCLIVSQALYSAYYNIRRNVGISYSTQFITNLKDNFNVKNKVGASIKYISIENENIFQYHPTTCQYTNVFDILGNGYVTSIISVPLSTTNCPEEMIPYIKHAPFYKFGNYKRLHEGIEDIGEIQKQFLQEYNIEYVLVEPGAQVPTSIQPLIIKTFLDDISGLKVLILTKTDY
jgi:hypothetical protein